MAAATTIDWAFTACLACRLPRLSALLWKSVGRSVCPSVVLTQPEPEEEEKEEEASPAPARPLGRAVFMVCRFISRSSHLGFSSLARSLGHRSDGQLGNGRSQHRLVLWLTAVLQDSDLDMGLLGLLRSRGKQPNF